MSSARRKRKRQIRFEHVINVGIQVTDMIQDRDGFLWFGGTGGIVRYDGYELKFYRKGPDALSGTSVNALLEDVNGDLWIGTDRGLTKFDREANVFVHYRHDPQNPDSLGGDYVQALMESRDGTLWVGVIGGLYRVDREREVFRAYTHDPGDASSLSDNFIQTIVEDREGWLWIGTQRGGLERLDPRTGVFTHFSPRAGTSAAPSGHHITAIAEDGEGLLWIGTANSGLHAFDRETGIFTHYRYDPHDPSSLSDDSVVHIYEDREGRLWIGCFQGGINRFDRESGTFVRHQYDSRDPHSLAAGAVKRIHQGPSDILWVALMTGQIDKYDCWYKPFILYQHDAYVPGSLSSNVVLPIYEDRRGTVWIGTGTGGLNRFNRETETFTCYTTEPDDPQSLPSPFVTAIFEDSSGTFWVATSDSSQAVLNLFDRDAEVCARRYRHDPDDEGSLISARSIRCIIEDRDDPNILWLAAPGGGLEKFDKKAERFEHYLPPTESSDDLARKAVWQIHEDEDGFIWIVNLNPDSSGLMRFDKKSETFRPYAQDSDSISDIAHAIFEDSAGHLWLGTDHGVNRFDRETGTFTRYTTADGLPDNLVYGIQEDDEGFLWISTNNGLVKFDPGTETFTTYGQKDGLQGDAFFYSACAKTRDGELWFGGMNGVNRFFPRDIVDNPHAPSVVLISIKQDGKEVDFGKDASRLREITLGWRNNYFEFEFVALDYTQPENNQYAYLLEGFDADWYYAGHRRFGRYSNLPGGDYVLRLKGSNNDGVWNETGIAIDVHVVPPLWQTVLRESEERFRSLVETSSDWIWEVNDEFTFTYASPKVRDILGYEPAQVVGRRIFEWMTDDEAQQARDVLDRLAQLQQPITGLEGVFRRRDGEMIVLEMKGVPILDDDGLLLGYRGINRDITRRKRAEEEIRQLNERLEQRVRERTAQLEATNKELQAFAYSVSHDLRAPLRHVKGFARLLQEREVEGLDQTSARYLNIIIESSEKMEGLINGLLTFSRTGRAEMQIQPVELSKLVREACSELAPEIEGREVIWEIGPLPLVLGDPILLRQVWINLISNALKFTAPRKRARIEVGTEQIDQRNGEVTLFVRDNGVGFDPRHRQKLFGVFQRLHSANEFEGSGIGLATVRRIVHRHGGRVWAEGEQGQGATFYFTLREAKDD